MTLITMRSNFDLRSCYNLLVFVEELCYGWREIQDLTRLTLRVAQRPVSFASLIKIWKQEENKS